MNCPECDKKIKLLSVMSKDFSCLNCGTLLCWSGVIFSHFFATVLFFIETMIIFSLVKEIWVFVVIISFLAVANYYVSFAIFLRVKPCGQ